MQVPKPLFLFLFAGAGLERPCQETAVLAGGTESQANMPLADAQSCDYVLLSGMLFSLADVMKVSILHYENGGQILHDPVDLRGQLRYHRRGTGSEKETREQSKMP